MSFLNLKTIEANWASRGFSFGIWTDPPGQRWENFVHDVDELFMVLGGEVILEMQGKQFTPQIGEEIMIPAGEYHSVRTSERRGSKWLYGYRRIEG